MTVELLAIDKIRAEMNRVNKGRRLRYLSLEDVHRAVRSAMDDGIGYRSGGRVSSSYRWQVTTPAVVAVALENGTYAVKFGAHDARISSSPVTWFGPVSVRPRHMQEWLESIRSNCSLLSDWIRLSYWEIYAICYFWDSEKEK